MFSSVLWRAKGIGVVREDDSYQLSATTDQVVSELDSTNLVAP